MTYAESKCRDCGHVERRKNIPSKRDLQLLRKERAGLSRNVRCPKCGGIMDPTPRGVRQIDEARGIPHAAPPVEPQPKPKAPRKSSQGRKAGPKMPSQSFTLLAQLLNTTDTYAQIAARNSVTRQRVGEIAATARKAGIRLPHRDKSDG